MLIQQQIATIGQLWRYPVKSMQGECGYRYYLDRRGVAGDRRFALRDTHGKLASGKPPGVFAALKACCIFGRATQATSPW